MKNICVSQTLFTKILGYGLVSLLTLSLLITFIASSYEIPTIHEIDDGDIWDYNDLVCYNNFFVGEKCTSKGNWVQSFTSIERQIGSELLLIIIAIGIGFWVYSKQQKFKFAWCENIND